MSIKKYRILLQSRGNDEKNKIRRRIKENINNIPTLCGCGCTFFNEITDNTEFECRKCGKIWMVINDKEI